MKYLILLLIAAVYLCSADTITRANYNSASCATPTESLYFVAQANFQCLTGTVYPFNGETRLYTCNAGTIQYQNCTDGGCGSCNGPVVIVGTSICIAWSTNDYSDRLSCGLTVPATPSNTPLVSQYDGAGCSGNLQYQGAYGASYCTQSGLKYSCNSNSVVSYNCTASGCGNCVVIGENALVDGSYCNGFTRFQCLNSTTAAVPTGSHGSTTTQVGTTTSHGPTVNVTTGTTTRASSASTTTSAPGGGDSSSDAFTVSVSLAVIATAALFVVL